MTQEEDLKPQKKAKPLLQPDDTSDLAWGIKKSTELISSLTKQLNKPKPTALDQAQHNAALIERLKQEIAAKEKIKEQYTEYKILVQKLRALEAEAAAGRPAKKKGIFK